MLTNVEKSLILQTLSSCIGDLTLILVDKNGFLNKQNKAPDPQEIEAGYKKIIDIINKAANNPLKGNEFDNEHKVGLFSPAGLEKVINKLRALFHPDYETFKKLQIIHNPIYAKEQPNINEAEFKEKIQAIKEFVPARLEKIISQRSELLPYKAGLQCLRQEEEKENNNFKITPI